MLENIFLRSWLEESFQTRNPLLCGILSDYRSTCFKSIVLKTGPASSTGTRHQSSPIKSPSPKTSQKLGIEN